MTRLCARCARKLEDKYIVTEEGGRAASVCLFCFRKTVTFVWEITPRRPRYSRSSGGGGERRKAEK